MYQWCGFKSRRGKNKNLTALNSNSNTVLELSNFCYIYVWKLNQTVLELDFRAVEFCSSLDGIWTHTIDTLQHHSLSLTSSALDHILSLYIYICMYHLFEWEKNVLKFLELVLQFRMRDNSIECCKYQTLWYYWLPIHCRGRRDHMAVGFTTTYAIRAYHH